MATPDIDDSDGQGSEHPFMGIGAEEIDVGFFHIDGKRSESLDGIEGEENSPIMKQLADRLDVDAVAVEEVGAGEGDELGFGGEGGGDQLGGDFAKGLGFKEIDHHPAPPKVQPRVNIGGVVALIAEDLIARFPI